MDFTQEQIAKAKAAKSAEELLALAKENGMEMTDDEAKKYFADLHKEGELADDELENVSGGCTSVTGHRWYSFICPFCGHALTVTLTYYSNCPSSQDVCNCVCEAGIRVYDVSSNASFIANGVEKTVDSISSGVSD